MWIVENRSDHQFYALKKIDLYQLDSYERLMLSVGAGGVREA